MTVKSHILIETLCARVGRLEKHENSDDERFVSVRECDALREPMDNMSREFGVLRRTMYMGMGAVAVAVLLVQVIWG